MFLKSIFLRFPTSKMNKLELTGTLAAHGLLFLGLCIACMYQSWKCVSLYNKGETSVKLIVIDPMAMRFPAVSVNSGFRQDVLGRFE